MRRAPLCRVALLLLGGALFCAGPAAGDRPRFLGEATPGEPLTIGRAHLDEHRAELGLTRADLADARERRYESARSGTTHIHLRQRVAGIEVAGGDLGLAVDAHGRVFARWSRFVKDAEASVETRSAHLDAAEAIAAAADALGLPTTAALAAQSGPDGVDQRQVFAGSAVSRDPIPAHLVYARRGDALRLAWNLVIRTPDGAHWWELQVDAVTGEVLAQSDWIARESYRVYPLPLESPDEGPRTLETNVFDANASPYGWHDTNGVAGAEFTDTRGNNVTAQEDQNGNDGTGAKPNGGGSLVFDFPVDFTMLPNAYVDAVTTNLFYWNNIAHDLFYRYGFDEPSGNFQENNYGNGGIGSDSVNADSLDGSDTNNAQFGTPPEGSNPRMEMFIFDNLGARVDVISPSSIAGLKPAGDAAFGPPITTTGVTGSVVQTVDNVGNPIDSCGSLTNAGAISGNIALMQRGTCDFTVKVKVAQDAGATAAIVVNTSEDIISMGGSDPTITIPSLLVRQSDGLAIEAELGGGVTAALRILVDRASSLDASVVLHEYGHGVSNRLTGGAANVSCLDVGQSVSMGEGWSDFFAMAFTAEAGEQGSDEKEIGNYVKGNPDGPGIRTHPYTTDLVANPLTLIDVETRSVPHAVGTVWAQMLWEVYWELVDAYGFDPDLYTGSGGNNLAIQLVVDGLKLQPCDPTFIEARDAILLADLNETGGANECYLWRAFAKRGIGDTAEINGNPAFVNDVTEDFAVPSQCTTFCGDGGLDGGEECDDGNQIDGDGCAASCETESTHAFTGVATGGSVTITVDGVTLVVPTSAGETAAQVAANVAAAINADLTLMGLGVIATASGDTLYTTGTVTALAIKDNGLAPNSVPLAPALAPLLALALLGLGARRLPRRRVQGRRPDGPISST